MIKEFYLTELEKNILRQFEIHEDTQAEQLEFLKNIKTGSMLNGFNGFIYNYFVAQFFLENKEIIIDIFSRINFCPEYGKIMQNIVTTRDELNKILSDYKESTLDDEEETVCVVFVTWTVIEYLVGSFLRAKILAFGE